MILPGSYQAGFAPRDGRALYPELWRGCVGAWAPCLGPTGSTLYDWSKRAKHGSLTNMSPADDWVIESGRYALDLDGSNDYVNIGSVAPASDYTIVMQLRCANLSSLGVQYPLGVSTSGGILYGGTITSFTDRLSLYHGGTDSIKSTHVPDTLPHVIAVTRRGTSIAFYVDGASAGTATETDGGNTQMVFSAVSIGQRSSFGFYFPGRIGFAMLYDRAIPASYIRLLSSRPGIAFELAPRRRLSVQVAGFNRRRRLLVGAGS